VAYASREVDFVINAAFSLRGLTSGALLGGILLAMFGKKSASAPIASAMFISFLGMVFISWKFSTSIFWPWYTLVGTAITIAAALGLQSLRRPAVAGKRNEV
jgi:hypothetical protein